MTITEQNRRSFLYALRTGRTSVVTYLLSYFPCTFGRQLENILLDPFPVLGTAARVATVQKEIFEMLKEMIVFGSPHTLHTFEIGINCTDVNAQDEDGFTLLMLAVLTNQPLYAKLLLAKESLEVNQVNREHYSALHFLSPYSTALVNNFLERQAVFHDVDFNHINEDVSLLVKTIQANRLDYAGVLLDCSSYHPSPTELVTARDILTLGKRVLLFQSKEDSTGKKMALLKLLHKVEMKGKKAKEITRKAGCY